MSDDPNDIAPTDEPQQPEPGPGYWPDEWQRHIERAERNLAENPPPVFVAAPPIELPDDADADGGDVVEETPSFDPGAATVSEVEEYVTAHPETSDDVLAAELAGKNRVTLVEWLQAERG